MDYVPDSDPLTWPSTCCGFPFTDRIFKMKSKNWFGVALHAAIHVFTTALLFKSSWELWPLLFALGILHFICDWAKLHYTGENQIIPFLVDQIAHLFVLSYFGRSFPLCRTRLANLDSLPCRRLWICASHIDFCVDYGCRHRS